MIIDGSMSSKGQLTVPKEIREFMGIDESGSRIRFITKDDGMCMFMPIKPRLKELFGMLPNPGRAISVEEMDAGIRKHVAKRFLDDSN